MEKINANTSTTATTISNNKLPVQTSVAATNLPKIAPKPQLIKTPQTGKIVYIKNSNGTSQQIRIGSSIVASSSTASANSNASTSYQISKTADGILQFKNKNVILVPAKASSGTTSSATATVSTVSPNNARFVLKSGTGSRLVLATPQTAKSAVAVASSNARTLTVSEAQQMGLISQANVKEITSSANANKTTTTSTDSKTLNVVSSTIKVSTPAAQKSANAPIILNKGAAKSDVAPPQKVIIQSTAGSSQAKTKAVLGTTPVSQNIVKLAPNAQLRALNVAGKGVQYVRVLNSISGASTPTVSTTKVTMANGRQAPVIVQRKVLPQSSAVNQTISPAVKTQQFITKKLEVTPIEPVTNPIPTRAIKKDGIESKPLLLNTAPHKFASSDAKSVTTATIKVESSKLRSPPTSPTQSNQKVVYRSYKLDDEQKPKSTTNQTTTLYSNLKLPSPEPIEGIRRKHCNCTKSQCLKLYCDCFANGEFCSNCNCKECFNTLDHEDDRQKAIKICLERNPHAFKPKIGKARDQSDALRRHTKGCNCKRSGCLKNYCECYEAKIVCSGNCKCIGCRNIDDSFDQNQDPRDPQFENNNKRTYEQREESMKKVNTQSSGPPTKRACNFITSDVIEATIQCVLAQADDCQKNAYDARTSERKILEEFGRCLVEIIDFSKKSNEIGDDD